MAKMKIEQDPEGMLLFKIWWAIAWRSFLWGLVGFVAILISSMVVGIVSAVMGANDQLVVFIFSFFAGIGVSIWAFTKAFKGILGKKIGYARVMLLCPDPQAPLYPDLSKTISDKNAAPTGMPAE